jgi:glycosyltransferase involved in cell wall biosynthesis
MRIVVCSPQVPFARGGAEILAETLVAELRDRGHTAELITIPFKWYPGAQVLTQALLWRLVDLDEVQGAPVDLVIATKFPSYVVQHPRKVVWLVHQFRQAYDLDRTELGQFGEEPFDRATRRAVHRLDRVALGEARRVFTISENVAQRLRDSTEIEGEVLIPPPQTLDYRCDGYDGFVLSVGRLDLAKRVDLLLQAVAAEQRVEVVVAGDGPDRARLEELRDSLGLNGRVSFAGRVDEDELTDLYARCLAVYYAPVDEDLGFVPYEAFLSEKPVITTRDAGGPLEVVTNRQTGLVCEPTAEGIAEACGWLVTHPEEARELGARGKVAAQRVTWEAAIRRLLEA